MSSPASDPSAYLTPMLAVTQSQPFDDPNWRYEVKWDGYRALIHQTHRLHVYSRRGSDLLSRFPELGVLKDLLPRCSVFDSELIGWGPSGLSLPSHTDSALVRCVILFDCLYSHGEWQLHRPLRTRQERLRTIVSECGPILIAPGVDGHGIELLGQAHRLGMEGVVAKHLDSPYLPGVRSPNWQKFFAHEDSWLVAVETRSTNGYWRWHLFDPERNMFVANLSAPNDWIPPAVDGQTWTPMVPHVRCHVSYRTRNPNGQLHHPHLLSWHPQ